MPTELLVARDPGDASATIASTRVRWLVDNAAAYDALLAAISAASESVWMSQLAFDADCAAYDATGPTHDGTGTRILGALVAATSDRGVAVRVLVNASLLLDTAKPLRRALRAANAAGIQVRGIGRFPQLLHAKIVVIDGTSAFLIGSPFANGYWDDSFHRPRDDRRPTRELGGRPLHDLSCALEGPVVAELAALFAELWNEVSHGPDRHEHVRHVPPAPDRRDPVRVVRTAPRGVLASAPDGVAEILSGIERALGDARALVYVEHQYLSARPVVAALVAALERSPALELIVVLNQNPDVTAYRGWQNRRLHDTGLLHHPRVGLFSLWTATARGPSTPRWDLNHVFVHSKALIVDDTWGSVGSANLDGVSLHSYGDDFSSRLGRRVFRDVRNFDVNVEIDDCGDAAGGAVRALRTRLWSEHLGVGAEGLATRPAGGWLRVWRAHAERNVAALGGRADAAYGGFVLPYSTRPTPSTQLAELGIDPAHVRLHFDPGWLEVHCSPNWVRNMFA